MALAQLQALLMHTAAAPATAAHAARPGAHEAGWPGMLPVASAQPFTLPAWPAQRQQQQPHVLELDLSSGRLSAMLTGS